jgi:hypothetical protein
MDLSHVVGWLLVLGAVTFGVGASNPSLGRAWTAPRETFLAIVARHPTGWRVTNSLFIGGTVLTTAGLAALVPLVPDGWSQGLAVAGATAFAIAAVLWIVTLVYRITVTSTTARVFAETSTVDPWIAASETLNGGLFTTFIVVAFAGLAAIGIATTAGGPIPAPLGWGTAALSGVLVGGLVLFGDMPPFTVYIAPLVFGIALLVAS